MSKLVHSTRLEEILATRQGAAYNNCDSNCTTGYDNDGSTGFEIFSNGFELAVESAGRPVTYAVVGETAFFFIGTEDEVCAVMAEEDEGEDDDYSGDEDSEG